MESFQVDGDVLGDIHGPVGRPGVLVVVPESTVGETAPLAILDGLIADVRFADSDSADRSGAHAWKAVRPKGDSGEAFLVVEIATGEVRPGVAHRDGGFDFG